MDTGSLWNKRAKAFLKEAAVYWSYAVRSGLGAFLLLFIVVGGMAYGKILQATPPDYPYWRITTPILTAVLALSPVRTFLKPADTVFLAPAEHKLQGYWLRSLAYSFCFQALGVLAVMLLLWPFYLHCEGEQAMPFAWAAALLLSAKLLSVCSRFHESRLAVPAHRAAAAAIRWLGALILAFALPVQGAAAAWGGLLMFAVLLPAIIWRLPKHRVPWEFLIQKEIHHLRAHYTCFSWFADVPQLQTRPKARTLLASLADRISFDKKGAYPYLYAKTFLRSEWFSIVTRLVGAAVVLFIFVENAVAETLIYAAVVMMATATVSSIEQSHRYSFWPELYPVSKTRQLQAIKRICLAVLLPLNCLAGAAFLLFHGNRLLPLAAAAAGFIYIWYYTHFPLLRKAAKRDEG